MENLLRDGDYVPNGFGGFTRLYGAQEVLAKALFKLTCRRGSFPFLQDHRHKPADCAKICPCGDRKDVRRGELRGVGRHEHEREG